MTTNVPIVPIAVTHSAVIVAYPPGGGLGRGVKPFGGVFSPGIGTGVMWSVAHDIAAGN